MKYLYSFISLCITTMIIIWSMGIDSSVGMAIVIVIGGVCWALYIWNKPNVDDDYSTGNEKEIKDMTHNVCLDIQTKKERENMTNKDYVWIC